MRRVAVLCLALLSALAGAVAGEELQRYEFQGVEMAVPLRVALYAPDAETAERASAAAFARFRDLNYRLSDYDAQSEIRQLCDLARPGVYVRVSEDLWRALRRSVYFAESSGGAFDPTVGQVVRLWRHARKARRLPDPDRLAETLRTVGFRNILFDEEERAVALSHTGFENHVRIDLGGIGKGYAIDEALRAMAELGVTRVLLDAGGDMGLGDPPPGAEAWKIAVTALDPKRPPTDFLTLSNCGLATSGDMYQHVEIDGVRYSHIVDPKTGLGLTHRMMVSVVAPNATDADAIASAVSVLGEPAGRAWAATLPGVRVQTVRVTDTGEVERFGDF